MVKSYKQFCGVAKALDVIGDRWSLLIVRELFLVGPCRYTDLHHGLPGIATNLLAHRLRDLEQEGVIRREVAPPPVATTLIRLTPRGEALLPVIRELGRWGAPLLAEDATRSHRTGDDPAHRGQDSFRSYWISLPLDLYYYDPTPELEPAAIEVWMDEEPITINTVDGNVVARRGAAEHPDAVMRGRPEVVVGLLSGRLSVAQARARGLSLVGDVRALERVRPRPGGSEPLSGVSEPLSGVSEPLPGSG